MELVKKTTILFPPDLYDQLARLARQKNTSVGELVRSACRAQYTPTPNRDAMAAVNELATLPLPSGSSEEMERESVPVPKPLQ